MDLACRPPPDELQLFKKKRSLVCRDQFDAANEAKPLPLLFIRFHVLLNHMAFCV